MFKNLPSSLKNNLDIQLTQNQAEQLSLAELFET